MKNLMTSIVFVFAVLGSAMAAGTIKMVDDKTHCPDNTVAVEKFVVTGGTKCPDGYVTVETYTNVDHYTSKTDSVPNQDDTGTYEYCAVGIN
jgi:hypothetical protein